MNKYRSQYGGFNQVHIVNEGITRFGHILMNSTVDAVDVDCDNFIVLIGFMQSTRNTTKMSIFSFYLAYFFSLLYNT